MNNRMNYLSSGLLFLALVLGQTNASAIKGHESRSLKGAAPVASSPVEKHASKAVPASPVLVGSAVAAAAAPAPVAAPIPILESSKKVYNDESIRRLTQQPLSYAASSSVVAEGQPQPIAPEPAVAAQQAPVVAAVVAPVEPVVASPVVGQAAPAVAAVPAVAEGAVPLAVAGPAPIAAPAEPVADKSVQMSERSAVKPVVEQAPVPLVSAPVGAPAEQHVPVPVVPVVSVVEPAAAPVAAPAPPSYVHVRLVEPQSLGLSQSQQNSPVSEEKPKSVIVVESAAAVAPAEGDLQAKKSEPVGGAEAPALVVETPVAVPAPDPGLVLSEPIDSTTKLLMILDDDLQKVLPQEEKNNDAIFGAGDSGAAAAASPSEPKGKSSGPLVPYSLSVSEDAIVPPMPVLDGVEKSSAGASGIAQASGSSSPASSSGSASSPSSSSRQGNNNHHQGHQHGQQNQQQVITQLMDQLDTLQNRIQDTINQLVARRRYVMSALLRPMGTYVRRVRTNLERLQNRVNQLQAAASSSGGNAQNGQRPGGFVDAAAIDTIRRRIDDISKRISDIVNRIRFSLTPTSAPLSGSNGK